MTPPNVLGAPEPTSSVMIRRMLGAPFGGTTRGGHQAFDCQGVFFHYAAELRVGWWNLHASLSRPRWARPARRSFVEPMPQRSRKRKALHQTGSRLSACMPAPALYVPISALTGISRTTGFRSADNLPFRRSPQACEGSNRPVGRIDPPHDAVSAFGQALGLISVAHGEYTSPAGLPSIVARDAHAGSGGDRGRSRSISAGVPSPGLVSMSLGRHPTDLKRACPATTTS